MTQDTVAHVVAEGEHLYEIAARHGVAASDIWSLQENAHLKDSGRTPSILAAGDVLIVPVLPRRFLAVDIGSSNKFTASPPTVTVSLKAMGSDGTALANAAWEVKALDLKGTSKGDGAIEIKNVPIRVKVLEVFIPSVPCILRVKVGGLDPLTTERGKAQRLAHLGYLPAGGLEIPSETIAYAVDRFRTENAPDAKTDKDVEDALLKAHGN